MVKHIRTLAILLVLFAAGKSNAQEGKQYIHKGLFCARGALSYGKMFELSANQIYLDGNIEFYLDEKVSLRGSGYWFLSSFNGKTPLKLHHSLFAGPLYHFKTKSHFDPYIGLEPGINLGQAGNPCFGDPCLQTLLPYEMEMVATPLISPSIGFNYYGQKWFHLWLSARYIAGRFMDNYNSASLNEFRISFGLGFNIN